MGEIKFYFFVILVLASLSFVTSQTDTQIEVDDSAPILIKNFEDIIIYQGEDATNYLDLDDYFLEPNGGPMSFSYTPLNNVTISIDSENRVSFIYDAGYVGSQFLQFNASDSKFTTPGNTFTITIGVDNIPPKWSNPTIDRIKVYQNYYVTFSTLWTDVGGLKDFVFSINQGTGWENTTLQTFTGNVNVSEEVYQISAAPGTTVYWRIYATDLFGNTNVTDLQNFDVEEFEISEEEFEDFYGSGGPGGGIGGAGEFTTEEKGVTKDTFYVDTRNIRISLRQGDTATRVIRITNTAKNAQPFRAEIDKVGSLAVLSETEFTIQPGDTIELLVEFLIPKKQMPDQYFGSVSIVAEEKVTIPIILDVKPFDTSISVSVNISDNNKFVKAGDPVTATIKIINLEDFREGEAELFYAVKDLSGNILISANESFPFTSSFEEDRTLILPEGTPSGEYLFYAIAFSQDRLDLDSDIFFVGLRLKIMYYLERFLYLLVLLAFLFVIFYLYLIYKRSKRKKKLLELYLLLNELRALVKKGKTGEALDVYKRIKVNYSQKIPKDFIKDQDKLRLELNKFAELLKTTPIRSESSVPATKPKGAPSKVPQKTKALAPKQPAPTAKQSAPTAKPKTSEAKPKAVPKKTSKAVPKKTSKAVPKSTPKASTKEAPKKPLPISKPKIAQPIKKEASKPPAPQVKQPTTQAKQPTPRPKPSAPATKPVTLPEKPASALAKPASAPAMPSLKVIEKPIPPVKPIPLAVPKSLEKKESEKPSADLVREQPKIPKKPEEEEDEKD